MTPKQQLDAFADLFAPKLRAAFLAAIQDIVDNVILKDVVDRIAVGDYEGAFRALGYNEAAMRPLTKAIEEAYEQGGVLTGQTFPKYLNTVSGRAVFRFNVRNVRAERWLREKSSTLITRIGDEIRTNIREKLTTGMKEGINPRTVALEIVGRVDRASGARAGGIIGLTVQQQRWAQSAETRLEMLDEGYFRLELRDKRFDRTVANAVRTGEPLPRDVIEKLIMRYKSNALKYRGDVIARTEALQSLNASEYEAMKQAVDMGAVREQAVFREWDSAGDIRVRHSHRELDGQTVGLNEPFVSSISGAQMMHPGDTSMGAPAQETIQCRCRVKSKIDWLDDLD